MKFGTRNNNGRVGALRRPHQSAFTLAEALAALMFMAIVIPVAVEVLHIASLSGEVAARKGAAARIADRVLNGSLVTTNWDNGPQDGTVSEGTLDFRWKLSSEDWKQTGLKMLTAEVTFDAQGKDYSVKLSTVLDPGTTLNAMQALQQQ